MQHFWRSSLNVILIACSCMLSCGLTLSLPGFDHHSQPRQILNREERNVAAQCLLDDGTKLSQGEVTPRLVENLNTATSVDICFVVSGTTTMPASEKWIQNLATKLDSQFKESGVGVQSSNRNRFCVVQFGARKEGMRAHSIKLRGLIFYHSENVTDTRSQLKRNGNVADGYEALKYTIDNVPFREDPSVGKGIILVTDTGRSVLADQINLTTPIMARLLQSSNISLDVVVDMSIHSISGGALGMLDYSTTVINGNGGTSTREEEVKVTSSHGDTLTSYVDLAFQTGGGAWLLSYLRLDVKSTEYREYINGFAAGYVDNHDYMKFNICKVCSCSPENENSLTCSRPSNQRACHSCIEKGEKKCLATTATTGQKLNITTITQQQGNNVNISFYGNRGDATFQCMDLNAFTPKLDYCVSPVLLTGLTAGRHTFLIIGRTVDGQTSNSKLLTFNISRTDTSSLVVKPLGQVVSADGQSVSVSFETISLCNSHVTVVCQVDDEQFQSCTSPFVVNRPSDSKLWWRSLTLIATDEMGGLVVTKETVYFSGEDRVMLTKHSIDSTGVLKIGLRSSNTPIGCISYFNNDHRHSIRFKPEQGKDFVISASPAVLGNGRHTVYASCTYSGSSYTVHDDTLEFYLTSQSTKNIKCSLSLRGPSANKVVSAEFNCGKETVTTTCGIGSLPAQKCTSGYSFNTSSLLPGYHLFTLTATDQISGSRRVNIHPFFVNASDGICCPRLIEENSKVVVENGRSVSLSVGTDVGNCTSRDEFSYEVAWSDGSVYSGVTAGHVTPLLLLRTYSTPGHYTATVRYCNNPEDTKFKCCSRLSLPLETR